MVRRIFWICSIVVFSFIAFTAVFWPSVLLFLFIAIPLFALGIYDMLQAKYGVLRLYPVVGHLRYILQKFRPQIQQYFIETNINGMPFSREERELVYARAMKISDTIPFGTQRDVRAPGFDSISHSLAPKVVPQTETRIIIGGPQCRKHYDSSRLNISAMSFGSLSSRAIQALNRGAKMGNFAHNTGEGGLSSYHLMEGGDLIWQLGTAYFGARTAEGQFDPVQFKEKSRLEQVKMIEIKLSQGAKPAHGGILPAAKLTPEIAAIRGVPLGQDVLSPPAHSAFSTPIGLLEFIAELRELSDGKPVGFKLCLGRKDEFLSLCKAMLETKIYPDFITIDGKEGGTGAAPVEFIDFIGLPLNKSLAYIHNALVGSNLREHIRLIASGKIISGFDMVCKVALGADLCNSARGMMFALGCIQSRTCHNNMCPTGVTTQLPNRVLALDIDDKAPRVKNFHEGTLNSFLEVLGAAGLERVKELDMTYIYRRVDVVQIKYYNEIFCTLKPGQLVSGDELPEEYYQDWMRASAKAFVNKPGSSVPL